METWLAVNKDDSFRIFNSEPIKNNEQGMWECHKSSIKYGLKINHTTLASNMQEITWKDNPIRIDKN